MAIKAVEWARRQLGREWRDPATGETRALGPRHVLALVELGDCINRNMTFAFPGPERLERATGLKERQQRRLMADLEAAGLIKAVQGKGRGRGRGREPNRYYLACDPKTGEARAIDAEAFATRYSRSDLAACNDVTPGQGGRLHPVKSDPAPIIPVTGNITGGADALGPHERPAPAPLDLELAVVASRMVDGEPIRAFLDGFAVEGQNPLTIRALTARAWDAYQGRLVANKFALEKANGGPVVVLAPQRDAA